MSSTTVATNNYNNNDDDDGDDSQLLLSMNSSSFLDKPLPSNFAAKKAQNDDDFDTLMAELNEAAAPDKDDDDLGDMNDMDMDDDDDDDEHRLLLLHHGDDDDVVRRSVRHVTFARSPLLQTIHYACVAVVCLGLVQFVVGFVTGSHGYAGSYVAYILGGFGIVTSVLAIIVLAAFNYLSTDSEYAISMLSYAIHATAAIIVHILVFGLSVLANAPLFWHYVSLHWQGELDRVYGTTLNEAKSHVRNTIITVGALALLSQAFMVLVVVCIGLLRLDGLVYGEQSVLWTAVAVGTAGCVLVGVNQYIWYHQGTVPISHQESLIAQCMGLSLFAMAVLAVFRVQYWPKWTKPEVSASHAGAMVLLLLFLATFSTVLSSRSDHIDDYLHKDNEFAMFGMHDLSHDDSVDKLKLTAQIQLALMTCITSSAAIYSFIGGVVFIFLDRFLMVDMQQHIQVVVK